MQRNRGFVSSKVSSWIGKFPIDRPIPGLGTEFNPALSGVQLYNAGFRTNGVYYLNPTGQNTFKAYVILDRDGGGWVKVLQYNNGVNMNTTAAVNQNGSWVESEINLFPGKVRTADFSALQTQESYLFRVQAPSGGDNLLNNGLGTGKLEYSSAMTDWGTDQDPTSNYTFRLDPTSNGTYSFFGTYSNDTRPRCEHGSGQDWRWFSDHNYSYTGGTLPAGLNSAQCFSHRSTYFGSNLHWMSGIANAQSGGELRWGEGATSSYAIFVK